MFFNPQPKPQSKRKLFKSIPKRGKKTIEWERTRTELNKAFAEVGITYDEVGRYLASEPKYAEKVKSFRHWFFINYAHGDKRDNLVGEELRTLVAKSCYDCHTFIEALPREEMRQIVGSVIARRSIQPKTYYKKEDE